MLFRAWVLLALGVAMPMAACGGGTFLGDHDPGKSGAAGSTSGAQQSGASGNPSGGGGTVAPALGGAGGASETGEDGGASDGGAPVAAPSISIVQTSRTAIVGNADPTLTLTRPPVAGNALIVGITCFSDFENCLIPEGGVTDNQGNEYVLVVEGSSIVSSDTHGTRPYLFIAENIGEPAGPLTISVNPDGMPPDNVQNFAWGVLEVSGLLAEHSVDRTGSFPNSCCPLSTTVSTDEATQQPNELAVAVHAARSNDNDFNYGHDPDWIQQHVNDDGVSLASQHSLVTRVLTETGVVSHTWTHDEPSRGVSAIIATFRGAAPTAP